MSDNRSYRIRTKVNSMDSSDRYLNVKLDSDFDILEVLSLKIKTENFYKIHTSDYGCIVGRVLANGGVGVPNAKISVFIGLTDEDSEDPIISELYPYYNVFARNSDKRYNLLPEDKMNDCHNPVGTFPNKRLVLDDDSMIEVFDKYYKFTTRTNDAGDYMIFGAPTGDTNVHVDLDLSDIGRLSQKPRDMIYKGYNINMFENANKFKTDDNLDNLVQLISQDNTVYVYPFWGNSEENVCKITRNDVTIQYKFEPTCIFLGSVVTDANDQGIDKDCIPTDRMGKMDKLTTGIGTIEMIRKTVFGGVEEKQIQGKELIDGYGTWCYQIPMNLDYYVTDEYGNDVPSNDPEKGIPTRTRVRFRLSMDDDNTEYANHRLAKILIPNNPKTAEDLAKCYRFGTYTNDDEYGTKDFRDLFSDNIYTVKQYIPRIQKGNRDDNLNFSGIKNVNVNGGNNPIPYNNMRVNLTFMFRMQCALLKTMIRNVRFMNSFVDSTRSQSSSSMQRMCTVLGDGICPDLKNWYFAPGCPDDEIKNWAYFAGRFNTDDGNSVDLRNDDITAPISNYVIDETNFGANSTGRYCITAKTAFLMQCVEINLAMEYNVIQFDFYNDWINGMIYIPRWIVNVRKKRSYLFGTIRDEIKTYACTEETFKFQRRYTQQCAIWYQRDGNLYSSPPYSSSAGSIQGVGCTPKTITFRTIHKFWHAIWDWATSDGWSSYRLAALGHTLLSRRYRFFFGWYTWLTLPLLKCHTSYGRKHVRIFGSKGGIVHGEKSLSGINAYYFKPCEFTSEGKKVNLFATDIVLLGSMNEYNENGVPLVMEELVTSTYNMPPNLAATNMDSSTFMLSINGTGTYCQETKVLNNADGDTFQAQSAQTFENYVTWMAGTNEINESVIDDSLEYSVTTTSGIDWGYLGPNQGWNDAWNMYNPGGHFLGISCNNAETNLKTCVNLSRICEYGSIMSQRQMFARAEKDTETGGENAKIEYDAIVPNGAISRYELTDTNFRRMFASLNFNGLKTVHDEDNYFMKYEFKYLHPTAYGGEFKNMLNTNSSSINPYYWSGWDDQYNGSKSDIKAYRRAVDFKSDDYLYFRLGLKDIDGKTDSEIKEAVDKKYLITNSTLGVAALPQYENSYYFYFGLNDGNTAINRFFKDFYATCKTIDEDANYISVEIHESEDNSDVKKYNVGISIIELEPPYIIKLTKSTNEGTKTLYFKNSTDSSFETTPKNGSEVSETYTHEYNPFTLKNLTSGNYNLTIITTTNGTSTASFNIEEVADDEIASLEYAIINYKSENYSETTIANYNGEQVLGSSYQYGGIVIYNIESIYAEAKSISAIAISNDEHYMVKNMVGLSDEIINELLAENNINTDYLTKFDYIKSSNETLYGFKSERKYNYDVTSDLGIIDDSYFVAMPAWCGCSMYKIIVIYKRGGSYKAYTLSDDCYIQMPYTANIGIGGTYLNTNRFPSIVSSTWFNSVLNNTSYSESVKWAFKKGLFSTNTNYSLNSENHIILYTAQGTIGTDLSALYYGAKETIRYEASQNGNGQITGGVTYIDVNSYVTSSGSIPCTNAFHYPTHYFNSSGIITPYSGINPYKRSDVYDGTEIFNGFKIGSTPKPCYYVTFNGKTVYLPAIYRPLCINSVKLVDEYNGYDYYISAVVNAITYNGKVSYFTMNSHCYTNMLETFNGDCINYKVAFDSKTSNYSKTNEALTVTYKEGVPTVLDDDVKEKITSYNGSIEGLFPSKVTDSSFNYGSDVKFFYTSPIDATELSYKDSNNNTNYFTNGSSTTSISGGTYYLYLKNVSTENDAVTFNFTGKTGVKYSCSSIGRFNCTDLLRGSMALIKKGCIDANGVSSGTTVSIYSNSSYYKNDNKYRHVIIPVNSGDILYIKSNIEYKFLSVNYTNSLKQVQTVYTKPEGGVVDTNSVTFDHSGHAIIWWDKSSVDLAKDTLEIKITYKNSSVFEMYKGDASNSTTNNEKKFTVYVKSANFASLSSVEINGSTFMKASGAADFMCEKTGNEACNTISYLNYLYNKKLLKSYDKGIDAWNGIFDNAVYKLNEVTDKVSLTYITAEANHLSGSYKMWEGFKKIINGTSANIGIRIGHDIIAICDKWTKLGSRYYQTVENMWTNITPDGYTTSVVKYYPMNITV